MKRSHWLIEAIKSSFKDHFGKESSARISSYIVLAFIMLNSLAFMVIEIVNAAIMWSQDKTYTIPTEHIWIFGLILSHHLGLLFYKSREFNGKNEYTVNSNLGDLKNGMDLKTEEEKKAEKESTSEEMVEYPDGEGYENYEGEEYSDEGEEKG